MRNVNKVMAKEQNLYKDGLGFKLPTKVDML